MKETHNPEGIRSQKRNFSIEEKRNYCKEWEKSGMTQTVFCKARGISKSALYQWNKNFKKEDNGFDFSPLVLEKRPSIKQTDAIQLNISLPNQMQLGISMPEDRLVSFIQEIYYATAVVR
jgi:transposase-like protein